MENVADQRTPVDPRHLADASGLMQHKSLNGPDIRIDDPWAKTQGRPALAAAVARGQLTEQEAQNVSYMYFQQRDGTLFCAIVIRALPGVVLGSTVPRGAWHATTQR